MRRMLLGLALLLIVGLAYAHPLGNNTVNRQAAIHLSRDAIHVRYLMDMAEIPTLLVAQAVDTDSDGTASATEWEAYTRRYAEGIRAGLHVAANGKALSLALAQTRWTLVPGAAGLSTLRLEVRLAAPLPRFATVKIEYRDSRRPEEAGWKEVVARVGSGVRLIAANVPQASSSRDLTAYPKVSGEVPNSLTATVEAATLPADSAESLAVNSDADRPVALVQGTVESSSVLASAHQAWTFFRLGVHHIASGWDHLVFLLGLLIAQTSLRRLAWTVTAFTAAHSLTLGLAAGGLVSLPGAWVEPAIALTIAYVGLSNLLGHGRHGALLAFAFGLVHGFGFAGALAESLGDPLAADRSWLLDLAAFNIGIEAFQLVLVLAILPLLRAAACLSWSGMARTVASLAVMGTGLEWFFVRL